MCNLFDSVLTDATASGTALSLGPFMICTACSLILGAAIAGGMGLAAGENLNPERKYPSMFEPIHGSAPDIAGQGKANPMAAIWSASQMLDYFGYENYGAKVLQAIEDTLVEARTLTADLGGCASTDEVGDAVCGHLEKIF